MKVEYHRTWSPALGRDMEFKAYGHAGAPLIWFPCQGGRFFEFEDFGMQEAIRPFLEHGHVRVFTPDSIDREAWAATDVHLAERGRRAAAYDRHIVEELVPYVRQCCGERAILLAGCSMGGYHAANCFFRHPDRFSAMISLSGLFRLNTFVGDYVDDGVYFHSPLLFVPNLTDPYLLDRLRAGRIVICCGQGAWEDAMVADALAMRAVLEKKGIPAWVDLWGHDVNHDWPWWRKQLPYFLGHVLAG